MEYDKTTKEIKIQKSSLEFYVQIGLIILLAFVIAYNAGKLYSMRMIISTTNPTTAPTLISASKIIPKGTPTIYGEELNVSYDDVSPTNQRLADETIQKLSKYENEELNNEQMQRYLKIAGSISCEYCCGAKALIFSNGQRACGCAHSYAMRGLAKYLLINHPEMSDLEILSELGKWKVLFFPEIHEKKARILEENGINSTDYINLASNLYRGIEQGKIRGGGMVGGC